MSVEAFNWVWSTTVGDARRKVVLLGLANFAHKNGRHAFPSRAVVAEYAECSVRTVDRVIDQLLADGFIRLGDQAMADRIRADRRPQVYDLAMSEATRLEWKAAHARGDILTPRSADPDLDDTVTAGRQDDAPSTLSCVAPSTGHGATSETPRGDTAVSPDPKTTHNPPAPTGCPRHPSPAASCRSCGTTPRQAEISKAREAEAARRAANDAAIQADRAAIAKAASAEQRAAHAREARRLIAAARGR